MAQTVICGRQDCSYRSGSGFCNRDFVIITPGGACAQFYFPNGQPKGMQEDRVREMGEYRREADPEEAEELEDKEKEAEAQDAE